jgi:molybdenum cofactor cytidylyltransferase
MTDASLLIMAGGKSERMRTPKPFLLIEGKSFIDKIADNYRSLGLKNIFIVLNHQFMQFLPLRSNASKIIRNFHPEYGRVYSLQTGLKGSLPSDFVFIHNVDNPFVCQEVIRKMWIKKEKNGFVVPMCNGKGGHPILISKEIVSDILASENTSISLRDLLKNHKRIEIETDSQEILVNVNTWEDYEEQVLNLIPENCRE